MATIAKLEERDEILRIESDVYRGMQPHRVMYGLPLFTQWMDDELPRIGRQWGGRLSPRDQVIDLFQRFIFGRKLRYGTEIHELRPAEKDVWELKTADIRIFGWFVERDIFIAVSGGDATFVKEKDLYHGFVGEVERNRNQLDLDEPKRIIGAEYDQVLSDAH